jgi:hypothetical protein
LVLSAGGITSFGSCFWRKQLDDEDKQTVMKIINTMLTKSKFKDFFNKNIAAL